MISSLSPSESESSSPGCGSCFENPFKILLRPSSEVDGLEVDLEHRRVSVEGKEVQLTPTEYDLLRLLVQHAGKVLAHDQILRQIWGPAYVEQPHVLRVNISNLRRKIEPEPTRPRYILTELGVGYRLRIKP